MGLLFGKASRTPAFASGRAAAGTISPRAWGRGYRVTAAQRAELQQALRGYYKAMGLVVVAMIVVQAFTGPLPASDRCRCGPPGDRAWSIALRRRRQRLGDAPPAEGRLNRRTRSRRPPSNRRGGRCSADRRPDHDARLGPGGLGSARPRHGNARGRRAGRRSSASHLERPAHLAPPSGLPRPRRAHGQGVRLKRVSARRRFLV